MAKMTREKHVGVKPAKEGDQTNKKSVQKFRFEDSPMTKFVHSVYAKVGLNSVHKYEQRGQPGRVLMSPTE